MKRMLDMFSFLIVGTYLTVVGVFLIATRRLDPGVSFGRVLRRMWRRLLFRPRGGRLDGIRHEAGHCYTAPVDPEFFSDNEGVSNMAVLEDGTALPHPHVPHETIRAEGNGTFQHWGTDMYFSSSDNTDPRHNGRSYTFAEVSA